MSFTLHGVPLSPYVRKVRMLMDIKGLPYQLKIVIPYQTPDDYTAINPLRRVPALEHNHQIICDSAIICDYIEQLYPANPLMPQTPVARARSQWLEKYADYELAPVSTFGIFREHLVRPTLSEETDHDAIRRSLEKLPAHLSYLSRELGDHQWFVEETLSIADIAVVSQLINLQHTGYSLLDSGYASLHHLVERLTQRDSLADILATEHKMVEKIRQRFNIQPLQFA